MTMKVGGVKFEEICTLSLDRDTAGRINRRNPQGDYTNRKNHPLHKHGHGSFCEFRIDGNLKNSGVYIIHVNGVNKYVGECVNLAKRFNHGYGHISPRNCFKFGRTTNCRINKLIMKACEDGFNVVLWFHRTKNHKAVEKQILEAQPWVWNKKRAVQSIS